MKNRGQAHERCQRLHADRCGCVRTIVLSLILGALPLQAASLPAISVQPQSRAVMAGSSVALSVTATGEGSLTYEWWNEFGPVYPPQTGASLVLASAQPGDAGRYTVRVRNAGGTVTSAEATLTVSPLNWDNVLHARSAGGTGADPGANLDTDSGGNVYAIGSFSGTATFGSASLTSAGAKDVFIVKFAPDGSVVWAQRVGGTGDDAGAAVSVDGMGNVHVAGAFTGTADVGGLSLQSAGRDAFVACFDRDGRALWAQALGGASAQGCRIACDAAGNSYVTGGFTGSAAVRGSTLTSAGEMDVFLAKWSASGVLLWARQFGGSGTDRVTGLALDGGDNALLTGSFAGTANFGSISLNSDGADQVYVLKCDRAGTVLWAQKTTGLIAASVLADEAGNVFLTGSFSDTATIGTLSVSARQAVDCFVAKLSPAGVAAWVARDGSESKLGLQSTTAQTLDELGSGSLDWSGGEGTGADLLVGKYPQPAVATWVRQAGANSAPFSFGLLTDGVGNRYLTGFSENPDGTENLSGDSLTLINLAKPAGPLPPLVTLAPQSLTVNAGTSASFSIAATGTNLRYQWRFKGSDIPAATSSSLTLTGVQSADAGAYSVVVFNSDGAVTSSEAVLTVNPVVNPSGPAVVVTSPAEGSLTTNLSFMVFGTASGNTAISRIEIQMGSGSVLTANGTTSWFIYISLLPGTNVFRARAVDVAGNTGAWTTRYFTLGQPTITPPVTQTSVLNLAVSGSGRVTPDLNGQSLLVGSNYTITAVPDSGNLFAGWSGGLSSANPVLTFTMQPNLSLRANFAVSSNAIVPTATNILVLTKASYNGLFYEKDAVRHSNSGPFTLAVSVGGSYSGSIRPGNKSVSISGKFTPSGAATNRVTLNSSPYYVIMQLTSANGEDQVTGSVQGPTWDAPLWAVRAASGTASNPVPYAGRYTVVIPGAPDAATSPGGHGFGTLTVDAAGKASLTATLADGTAITRAVALSAQGAWPFYASLYSDKGSTAGWIAFADRAMDDLFGNVSWESPSQVGRKRYANGFTNSTSLIGSRYVKPAFTTNRVLNFDYGVADFAGGNLPAGFQNQIYLTETNKVLNLSSNKLSITFTLSSGTFSGSATEPSLGKSVSFKGAVLQKRAEGAGQFLGTNQTGKVDFGK